MTQSSTMRFQQGGGAVTESAGLKPRMGRNTAEPAI